MQLEGSELIVKISLTFGYAQCLRQLLATGATLSGLIQLDQQ